MMNVNKLKGKMVEKGLNVERMAGLMGVDRASLYRKMNNSEKFTIGDAIKIKEVLSLSDTEAYDIFLA